MKNSKTKDDGYGECLEWNAR